MQISLLCQNRKLYWRMRRRHEGEYIWPFSSFLCIIRCCAITWYLSSDKLRQGFNITMLLRRRWFIILCMHTCKAIILQYADGDLFTISHMDAYDSTCHNEVLKNISNYNVSSSGDLLPPPEVISVRCPNQCSLQGSCNAGVCVCNQGYTSADCSVVLNQPPVALNIREWVSQSFI